MFRWISGHSFHRYHNYLTDPDKFETSLCRACKEKREETSHLYAFCDGLAHVRMRILGKTLLEPSFEWQPHQLISMIEIIDKLYPEEGIGGNMANGNDNRQDGLEDMDDENT
jgi:hypothetical protein